MVKGWRGVCPHDNCEVWIQPTPDGESGLVAHYQWVHPGEAIPVPARATTWTGPR